MKMKNINTLLLLKIIVIASFLSLSTIIFLVSSEDMQIRKNAVLSQQITDLDNTYKVSMKRMEIVADTVVNTFVKTQDILSLLYKAKHTTDEVKLKPLRRELYRLMKPHFENLKNVGVIITLFSFPDNKTFLRVHKPNKFNDDLSKVRYSFKYVNEHKEIVRGLEEGKIMHAFRNIYPLYYRGQYIGSVDIAFSSEVLLTHLKNLYRAEAHFIIDKNVFMSNIWKMKDMVHYIQSVEHKDFLQNTHEENSELFFIEAELNHKFKKEIYENIAHKKEFSLEDSGKIISFLPVKNIKDNKTIAYLVSYIQSDYLANFTKEYYLINALSTIVLLLISLVIYFTVKNRLTLNIGLVKEVEDQNKAFKTIFEKASDGIIIIEENTIIECNEAILNILGYEDKSQLLGNSPLSLSPMFEEEDFISMEKVENVHNFERQISLIKGEYFWVSITLTVIIVSSKPVIHTLIKDITKQKQREEELLKEKEILDYKANHDLLTMLPNRALLNDRLNQSIGTSNRYNSSFALMFIDLDKFKPINDTLGHSIGDIVLQTVASRLQSTIRDEDTLARLGGDEFVILMQNLKQLEDAAVLAKKVTSTLEEEMQIDEHKLKVSASIGISLYPLHTTDAKTLLEYADIAMYEAKQDKHNSYKFYSM